MTLFVESQSFISPPRLMFVSAVVSEICELNHNKKKNSEIGYFQFSTFPGHIIYPSYQRYIPFEHMYAFNFLEVPYTIN